MEHSSHSFRKPSQLSAPIHQQLNLYALAAGVTGAAMLAGAQPAQAEVVYTPADHLILTHQRVMLDLNHDGMPDFAISNKAFCTTDICGRTLLARPLIPANQVEGMKSVFILKFASALPAGAKIGGATKFSGRLMAVSGTEYGSGGDWMNVNGRYLGLKFVIGGAFHYGWARFDVQSGNGRITAKLTGYAYETIPNKPIIAGQQKGNDESLGTPETGMNITQPEAASVGLLATGSLGLPAWRRE